MTDREDHAFSDGTGFDDPYEGFHLDPAELTVDLEPDQLDPTDSHALPELIDEDVIPREAVDTESLIDIGLSYMEINRFEDATETFERAAQFATDELIEQEAWVNKGSAHAELDEWDPAIGAFEEAIFIDDSTEHAATAENNLAFALWEFGKDNEALEHAERALGIDDRFAEAWYNRGFFLNERGLSEQAVDSLENALRLGYRAVEVYEEKARAHEQLNEEEQAEALREKVEEIQEREEQRLVK